MALLPLSAAPFRLPTDTFADPPRHLHSNDQEAKLTHWMSGSVPWDASDTVLSLDDLGRTPQGE